jgi:RHS repeat-associated protein
VVETLSSSAYNSRCCSLCSPKATAPTLNWLGTAPLNIAYTLNATGNRTARAESFAGTTRREAYGAIDQLIESRLNPVGTADERRVGYVYDAAGNRTRVVEDADGTGPGAAQERVYSANALNQYTAISGLAAPLHDIDGNTTLLQSGARLWSYQYDAQNRLVSGTDGATTFQFHYDARNRCVSRVINGETRYLTYDGWSLLEDRDGAGRLSAKHLHGVAVDEVLATVTSGGARYFHQDGLGNVVALTDGSGAVLERVRYDAYGQPEHLTAAGAVSGASPTGNRFLFTGREWFSELGLQDNRYRYYQPGVGRWLSRDPIEEEGGMNLLEYVGNNPIAGLDPDGLKNCNAKELAIVRAAFTACKAKAQTTYVGAVNAAKRRQDAMVAAAQTVKNGEYKLAASVYNAAKSACDAICDPGDREICNTTIAEAKEIAEGAADAAFGFAKTVARTAKVASISAARVARAVQENTCLNSARAKCDNF